MKSLYIFAAETYDKRPDITGIVSAFIVVFIDYITGRQIDFPILYGLPIALSAWKLRKNMAYALSVFLPLIRLAFLYHWSEIQPFVVTFTNISIIMFSLLLYAYLIQRTAWQTQKLKKKVKSLEGFLPICASCKKIRNEKGEYEQIEKYVSEHSEALFSHGICPECAQRLYPEFTHKP
ncbi:hypothetical protein [Desulfopila aestuarii]|uniref:Uncharacterized protein n=1 Tax=Desulfopila aestuarii DSM 18488 TaxID=1121416 RepID=A0A1M7YKF6_9BACT|nr:hypothetical protein [Desulfopila aestuarii]SHO53028.1 hypothetical protein SAMN02745220_04889 [Desulfopila aestuarii DSM 18488]